MTEHELIVKQLQAVQNASRKIVTLDTEAINALLVDLAERIPAAAEAILEANREGMVRKSMVDKGNSREKAENDTQLLFAALGHLERATLTLRREAGRPQAQLEIRFK